MLISACHQNELVRQQNGDIEQHDCRHDAYESSVSAYMQTVGLFLRGYDRMTRPRSACFRSIVRTRGSKTSSVPLVDEGCSLRHSSNSAASLSIGPSDAPGIQARMRDPRPTFSDAALPSVLALYFPFCLTM